MFFNEELKIFFRFSRQIYFDFCILSANQPEHHPTSHEYEKET